MDSCRRRDFDALCNREPGGLHRHVLDPAESCQDSCHAGFQDRRALRLGVFRAGGASSASPPALPMRAERLIE